MCDILSFFMFEAIEVRYQLSQSQQEVTAVKRTLLVKITASLLCCDLIFYVVPVWESDFVLINSKQH